MGFPTKYLNEGEEIVLDQRPHWIVLVAPLALVVAALALLGLASVRIDGDLRKVAMVPGALLLIFSIGWFVLRYARWATTSFVVTTDRIIHRMGVISKSGREIPLERLNDISFHQTLFQRIVNSGDLLIESAGERGQQMFSNFSGPERTQNLIHREIELAQERDADRMAGRRELSPLEQLEKLEELRQRGVISQAEFDAKKSKLLDRM